MKTIMTLIVLTLPVLADPGARMTPERQIRIARTIKLQREILHMQTLGEERATYEKVQKSHVPPSQK